jgi:hypothetical protein
MRYLGYGASRIKSFLGSSFSGFMVSMCSCNVVPVADSIYRQGAGIGPTFTFLFAGPAINIVTLIWVFQVVGVKMGMWRMIAVPICAILSGVIMQFIFRREDAARHAKLAAYGPPQDQVKRHPGAGGPSLTHVALLFGMLLAVLLFGSPGIPWQLKLPVLAIVGTLMAIYIPRWFDRDDIVEWMRQTGKFLLRVLPILLPVIFLLGVLQTSTGGFKWVLDHIQPLLEQPWRPPGASEEGASALLVDAGGLVIWIPQPWMTELMRALSSYGAALFGSLMYFPMLTEVAFTKIMLKDNIIAVGPALAILLNGPGVSLPGAILLVRIFGWKKTLVYEGLEIFLGGTIGYVFGSLYGDYECPCQKPDAGTFIDDPSSLYAAAILFVCLIVVWTRTMRRNRGAPAVG